MTFDLKNTLAADRVANPRTFDFVTVLVFRINQAAHRSRLRKIVMPFAKALDLIWVQCIIGAELPGSVECGPGLRLPHAGRGVIVNANSRIGSGVTLYHRVTLGQSGPDSHAVPTIEDGVYLGAGATVAGRVTVGKDAKIGAGAVVVKDVPSGRTAVGVPAAVR